MAWREATRRAGCKGSYQFLVDCFVSVFFCVLPWPVFFRGMALSSTIYNLDIDLSDSDRSVYESLSLRVARHPSESEEYLVTRVLAYALEYTEGITFSHGLCDPDDPAIAIRDLTGALQ